ncbi:MAG TPA: hypothetical protein VFF89_04265 [Sphingobium sp.]|nr:hypothetical protein [Sphingobium sp.]
MAGRKGEASLADWLQQATEGLSALPAHETVRDVLWIVPASQTVHILAVSVVFSGSLVIALRALGLAGTHWTLGRWHRRLSLWTGVSLLLLLLSGAVLVLAEPERELLNSFFQIKIPLVVATALLSYGLARQFGRNGDRRVSLGVKLGAVLVFALWAIIMGLGRWIAYAG